MFIQQDGAKETSLFSKEKLTTDNERASLFVIDHERCKCLNLKLNTSHSPLIALFKCKNMLYVNNNAQLYRLFIFEHYIIFFQQLSEAIYNTSFK